MLSELLISYWGVFIHGRPFDSNPSGLFVKEGGFVGWDDGGAESRRAAADRPTSHGSFDAPVYLSERVVTISGYALAGSQGELAALRALIMGAGAEGGLIRVTVKHQGLTLWADGRQTSATFTDAGVRHGPRIRGEFEVQFTFADPRKYGEARSFTGDDLAVSHRGNVRAPLEFVVPNGPANWEVGAGTRTIYVRGMAAGGTHRLDMRTGRLYRNNELQFGKVSGDVWSLAPGTPTTHSISGAGSFEVRTVDTYV